MTNAGTISVVIPTCDRNELLHEAIDSVLQQSPPPFEIIVVNNGEAELALASMPPIVKVLRIAPYVGVSQARNAGAWAASGEYLAFLDDDDKWSPDYLLHADCLIQQERPEVILATLNWVKEGVITRTYQLPGQVTNSRLLLGSYVSGSNIIVKKDVFERVKGFDARLSWGEDVTLIVDILSHGGRMIPVHRMRTLYRQHTGARLTGGKSSDKIRCYYERNIQRLNMSHRMYWKMRIAREQAREMHSLKHYFASKFYRASYKLLSIFDN